ncbi:MAG: alpha-2-macroglobulin family protein [Comamonas sp.]
MSALCLTAAQAAQISQVTPQGTVKEVRQVVVQTTGDVVQLGHAQAAAPVRVQCTHAQQGKGRWNHAREWIWQLDAPVPAGTRCQITPDPAFKLPSGQALQGSRSYAFEVAGPSVLEVWPASYEAIDEEQSFVLGLNGLATPGSVAEHVHCSASDIGERIPVQVLDASTTQALRTALDLPQQGHYVAVQCQRRMTAGSSMQLVYGAGVSMPSGVRNSQAQHFDYQVREAFTAELQCQRERANSGCLPIRDVVLAFSAPVPVQQARQIQLVQDGKTLSPAFEADRSETITQLRFKGPFTPLAKYQLQLPSNLQDDAGRALVNAASFPLTVAMGDTPPLLKFAAAPFGVLERFSEGPEGTAVLPVTVRQIHAGVSTTSGEPAVQLRHLRVMQDADIIAWWDRIQRYDRGHVQRKVAQKEVRSRLPAPIDEDDRSMVETRAVSLLEGWPQVQMMQLPTAPNTDGRASEVLGITLKAPGLHVLEAQSPRLGAALLDERLGEPRSMYVRTAALVTNLAVHLKLGREGSAVWVTSLDKGQSVAGARVQVSDCRGQAHAQGQTDAQGLLLLPQLSKEAPRCEEHEGSGQWFVSARQTIAEVEDVAFVWSDWQRGIEPWRFNLPTGWDAEPEWTAHTMMDRNLVRAGETVSMKHWVRQQTLQGLTLPADAPVQAIITHVGSNQQYKQALQWQGTRSGGRNATSTWTVPKAAKLGLYTVELQWPEGSDSGARVMQSGQFRVEAFRLPVFHGSIQAANADRAAVVQPTSLPVTVSLNYLNGGAARGQNVQVSAMLREHTIDFERWNGYSFRSPRAQDQPDRDSEDSVTDGARLVADKLPLQLDVQGQGQVEIANLPAIQTPQQLVLEASFADPNGEIQTLRSTQTLWPSSVVVGLRTEGWISAGRTMRLQAVTVDSLGQPKAGVPVTVQAVHHTTTTTRKRLVGGFYSYDNQRSSKNLGDVCSGTSDARGLLLCDIQVLEAGEVELIATAKDGQARSARAAETVWVSRHDELWFGGQDHDRMDVLLEKDRYAPGETAKIQVRMPFREATALVTVEREGVLHAQLVQLKGQDPTFELPVQPGWGPNVYVSVLALRGRLYEVPWYSFFTWGYKMPRQWWNAFWNNGQDYVAPTAMVDLSKPAFRLGVAELKVQDTSQQLQVSVQADKSSYQIRDKAEVTIRVRMPDGSPAAHTEVAVAAVDKALLELSPNTSWAVLAAMWPRRNWSVETATAQMEVVGRRHYGRKAAAPGGGGGSGAPTRELLDTLLLWQPRVQLDAQGQAVVQVPLNDVLSSFTVVAVAEEGVQRFGSGSTDIRTTQDLQLISGLPPVVREGDRFTAMLTVRNSTAEPMQVQITPQSAQLQLQPQTVEVAAQSAQEVRWDVTVPSTLGQSASAPLSWRLQAQDSRSGASDALTVQQLLLPAVPLVVQQASLVQIDGRWEQSLERPEATLPGQGGVRLQLSAQIAGGADGVPGLRDWWAAYAHACLEQTMGKALGLGDHALWQRTMEQLPTYLDDDGLAMYFPVQDGRHTQGSDALTAHVLQLHYAMQALDPRFALPADARARMESGLLAFVEGRIERRHWSPRQDLDVRKLSAIAALAQAGKARAAQLQSLELTPLHWPTHALVDWYSILLRLTDIPQRDARLQEVEQLLRSRLSYQGSQVGFSTDAQDQWWWLMQNTDVNVARLLLITLTQPSWDAERARLVRGLMGRQQRGHWGTTVANTWVEVALRSFSQRYEDEAVTGHTTALLGAATQTVHWDGKATASAATGSPPLPVGSAETAPEAQGRTLFLPWGERRMGQLSVQHRGTGKPWVAVQSMAAVPRTAPFNAGYVVRKTTQPVQGAQAGDWRRGDVVRVRLEVEASADMTWVALNDPIPAGASILGSGLGRDSAVAQLGEGASASGVEPVFVERGQDSLRAYWDYLPQGKTVVEYTLRLNNAGDFALPPTRVEALYAPEMWGELPNARWKVEAPR